MYDSPGVKRVAAWSTWFTVGLFLCLPVAIYAAVHTPIGSASVHEWLPSGQLERLKYDRFVNEFGQDQFLIVSWDDCSLSDTRLLRFKQEIEVQGVSNGLIQSALTTDDAIQSLTSAPISIGIEDAKSRLSGYWIGESGTAATLIRFTAEGIRQQGASIESVMVAADLVEGLGRDSLRMAGTLYESRAVDVAAEDSLRKLVLPSTLAATLVAWLCLGTLRYAFVVFLLAGLGQLSSVAMVYFTGGQFSAVLIVLPTLVFMLTLAGAVHLVSYYKELKDQPANFPGVQALLVGFVPCLLSSVTTIIGDGSLIFSQLSPIREFGLYCGIGLTIATVLLFLAFPALIEWLAPPTKGRAQSIGLAPTESEVIASTREGMRLSWVQRVLTLGLTSRQIAKAMCRWSTPISVAGLLLLIVTSFGMFLLKTTTKFDTMFSKESRTIRDMAWLESHFGPLASIEVLIRFGPSNSMTPVERALCVERIEQSVRERPEVGGVLSAVTFLPTLPQSNSIRSVARRAILNQRIEDAKGTMIEQSVLSVTDQGETWRLTAKISSLQDQDYGYMSEQVQKGVDQGLEGYSNETIDVSLTGLSPVLHHTQKMLLWDLGSSFASAFLMITPIMMFVGRGIFPGLLIMVPNVVPITIVFGVMGWCGWKLDIAGILTASIALGIAVDDTLHFVTRYMSRLGEGDSPQTAVEEVLKTCGNAILFTTLINCFAMLPFVWSEFMPTSQFAFMMISILALAVFGDLFLLPALLLSPFGQRMVRARSRK